VKLGVVLFNLGGPDTLDAVAPFLRNLFSDKAIISIPWPLRPLLARTIARRREPYARGVYESIGGGSPIAELTAQQAKALEVALAADGHEAKVVVAMRYWTPRAAEAVAELEAFAPERVVLLPLYPQFSTATTASSLAEWNALARGAKHETRTLCCYPQNAGFIEAYADLLRSGIALGAGGVATRVLFSAHGLPERTVKRGDPYPLQVAAGARAIVEASGLKDLDWRVTYQSRVGPLKWIGPDTSAEIEAAARERKMPVIVPLSFVSEHSETLYELDMLYRELALKAGAPGYLRIPAVGTHPAFIRGLAGLVATALSGDGPAPRCGDGARFCPAGARACPAAA
jgi:ferrochelatase